MSAEGKIAMDEPLTEAERKELEEFIAHLETLTEGDLQIIETKVFYYPAE